MFNMIQNYLVFPLKNELTKTWDKHRASFKTGCQNVLFFSWYLILATLSCIFTITPNNSKTENLAMISCLIREDEQEILNNSALKKTLYSLIRYFRGWFPSALPLQYLTILFHRRFTNHRNCFAQESKKEEFSLFVTFLWLAALALITFSHLLP